MKDREEDGRVSVRSTCAGNGWAALFAIVAVLPLIGCARSPTEPSHSPVAVEPPVPTNRQLSPSVNHPEARVWLEPDAGGSIAAVGSPPVLTVPLTVTGGARLCASAAGHYAQCVRVLLPLAEGELPDPIMLVQTTPGCDGQSLVDPKEYFFALINRQPGQSANDWERVIRSLPLNPGPPPGGRADPRQHYGITVQYDAQGPRPRLYLPTDGPDGLGYYTRPVNILFPAAGGFVWGWQEWGNPPYTDVAPPYAPRPCP